MTVHLKGTDDRRLSLTLAILPLTLLSVLFLLPYGTALASGLSSVGAVLEDSYIRRVIAFTLKQAALSTLGALALGLPGAWLMSSPRTGTSRFLKAVTMVPFVLPPVLVVLGFVLFFGNSGHLNRMFGTHIPFLYSGWAIILAHAFYNFPIVISLAGNAFKRIRAAYDAPTASLGASSTLTFCTVTLPLALPAILTSCLLVFIYCAGSFAIVLVLGGGPSATTLSVEMYRAARIDLNLPRAGALAILETALAFGLYLLYSRAEAISRRHSLSMEDTQRESGAEDRLSIPSGLYLTCAAVFILGPLFSIPLESLLTRTSLASHPTLSIGSWIAIAPRALPAALRSLAVASLAATASVLIAILASSAIMLQGKGRFLSHLLRILCLSPLVSSSLVLSLGWIRLYGVSSARSPLVLALLHAVIALPFSFKSIQEEMERLPVQRSDASASLGARPFQTLLYAVLPGAFRGIRSAWAFAAAISLGELNAALMLGMEGFETLPVLIYRASGAYRYAAACAAGTLLALACILLFMLSQLGERKLRRVS